MKRNSALFDRTFVQVMATALVAVLAGSGCATLNRSTASGYAYRHRGDAEANSRNDRLLAEREASVGELGLTKRSLDDDDAEAIDLRTSLRKAEQRLEGRRETEQYYKNKPYFRNDRDRLAFLNEETFEARAGWLNKRGIQGSSTPHNPGIQALIEINDITLGMTKQAVKDSWGEPELVEVAGNPVYGNERWHYQEQVSSTEGYQTEQRLVYFESGRVSGWETR